jgi:hypothetical protein
VPNTFFRSVPIIERISTNAEIIRTIVYIIIFTQEFKKIIGDGTGRAFKKIPERGNSGPGSKSGTLHGGSYESVFILFSLDHGVLVKMDLMPSVLAAEATPHCIVHVSKNITHVSK